MSAYFFVCLLMFETCVLLSEFVSLGELSLRVVYSLFLRWRIVREIQRDQFCGPHNNLASNWFLWWHSEDHFRTNSTSISVLLLFDACARHPIRNSSDKTASKESWHLQYAIWEMRSDWWLGSTCCFEARKRVVCVLDDDSIRVHSFYFYVLYT